MNRRDRTSQFSVRSVAGRACAVLIVITAATAAADEPATNLSNMVVTPRKPAVSTTAAAPRHVRRVTLKLEPLANVAQPASLAAPASALGILLAPTPPQPLLADPPVYPDGALKAGTSGSVTVAFTVQPNGRTADIRVVAANPPGMFDQAAVAAVRGWRFRPAIRSGKPVAAAVTQTLEFESPAGTDRRPAVTRANAADTAPLVPADIHPVHIVAPAYPPNAYAQSVGGSVTVEFVVATDGRPTDVRVLAAHPRGLFERSAVAAVKQWRFEPVTAPTRVVQTIRFKPSGG